MAAGRARVYAELVGSVALWGGTWVSGRMLAQDMGPFSAAFLRFLSASAFLFFLSCRAEGRLPRLAWRDLPLVLLLGLFGVSLYNYMFFSGLKTVPAGRAALMIACTPTVMAVYAALFRGERLGLARFSGILLSLCGAAVLLSHGDPRRLFTEGLHHGDLFIVGCVFSWAAYSILGGRAMSRLTPLSAVTWSCILGMCMLLPVSLAMGLAADAARASLTDWGNILFLGVAATGVAFTWYYRGIRELGASRAGVFINLVPVFAVALGWLILDEPIGLSLATGAALVLTGVWLTNRKPASGR
jgi:drug/metabolite transporter (DMT)-like permease